jgi:hypothetical protein
LRVGQWLRLSLDERGTFVGCAVAWLRSLQEPLSGSLLRAATTRAFFFARLIGPRLRRVSRAALPLGSSPQLVWVT